MRRSLCVFIIAFFFLFSLFSCQKKIDLNNYQLVENDHFFSETYYALIRSEFLRLRENPDFTSIGIATFYQYDMVQVVLMVKQVGGWCRLLSEEMQGWLPVDQLIFFESYEDAKKYQKGYRNITAKKN